jgi:hypothetical protein
MRTVLQIVLGIAIIVLAYFVYESIMTPIRFNKAKNEREKVTIAKMMSIRDAQRAYKDLHLKFTSDFDTLIDFLANDSFAVTKAIGDIPENIIDSFNDIIKAREYALKKGIIRREVTRVPVKDSILGEDFAIDSIRYVPFTAGLEFTMEAGEYETQSSLMVKVLEVSVLYEDLLKGLDPQLVVNYIDERLKITNYPGLKFGSLTEGTLTGNWE